MTSISEEASGKRMLSLMSLGITALLTFAIFGPILYYLVLHWRAVDDYSHGFLIAPLAIYFAWERRGTLRSAPIEPSWWGALPLALGVVSLTIGRMGVELTAMRVAFVLTLNGLVLLFLGRKAYRILAFPLLFLFLAVPLPQSLVNIISFPLQLVAADLAVSTLQLLGFAILREGNIIHLPSTQLFVADACSGLRSLMALGTLGVVFAYFFRKDPIERIVIVLSTIPIAILVNSFRVGLTTVLAYHWGGQMANGVIHQTEGFFTFAVAFVLLLAESSLLALMWPKRWRIERKISK
ncbi:MAG: exosortase/archaeosortase family protein [Myxococcales bacterium]|nr:exosortase/archaeosortase family protein [Myxococcales bacterium]MDH5534948.1 exosortase/archaeosortase family protein [Betaproteobacteria bacterium]